MKKQIKISKEKIDEFVANIEKHKEQDKKKSKLEPINNLQGTRHT